VIEAIEPGRGQARVTAKLDLPNLRIELTATALDGEFILLQREGSTNILTTLNGSCEVRVASEHGEMERYFALSTCLMEFKRPASPDRS
jgi:hypothetical protein